MERTDARLAPPRARGREVSAIFFDLDDTLFDHTGTCEGALRHVVGEVRELRRRPFPEVFQKYCELLELVHPDVVAGRIDHDSARDERFRQLLLYVGVSVERTEAHRISTEYRRFYQNSRRLVPGARELLTCLRGRVQVGIISNNQAAEQKDKLHALHLTELIDLLVTSEEARVAKPAPEIFAFALLRAGVSAGEAVMVGDNWPVDIEGALSSGLRAIWFNRWGRAPPAIRSSVEEIRSLEPTPRLIGSLLRTTPEGSPTTHPQ